MLYLLLGIFLIVGIAYFVGGQKSASGCLTFIIVVPIVTLAFLLILGICTGG